MGTQPSDRPAKFTGPAWAPHDVRALLHAERSRIQVDGRLRWDRPLAAEVELNMGHGNPATLSCLKYGLRPSISIDVCTSVGGDMFTQIRVLMAATRGVVNAEALKNKKLLDPLPLTARDMLDFATLQGAKAANVDHRTGSLTPGKDADLIILDTNSLNMFPVNNPVGAVIEDAHVGNIDSVFVKGRAVKR